MRSAIAAIAHRRRTDRRSSAAPVSPSLAPVRCRVGMRWWRSTPVPRRTRRVRRLGCRARACRSRAGVHVRLSRRRRLQVTTPCSAPPKRSVVPRRQSCRRTMLSSHRSPLVSTFEYVRQIVPSPVVAMGGGGPPTLVHLGFAQSIDLTTVGLPAGTGFDGEEAMASPSGTVAAISGVDGSTVIVTFAAGTATRRRRRARTGGRCHRGLRRHVRPRHVGAVRTRPRGR